MALPLLVAAAIIWHEAILPIRRMSRLIAEYDGMVRRRAGHGGEVDGAER